MPARSEAQRRLMAIAEHEPEKLYRRNQSLAQLPKQTLHDFAATPTDKIKGIRVRKTPINSLIPKKVKIHPALDVIRSH